MRPVASSFSSTDQQTFAVSLAKWTIGFWTAVYVVLTFRSVLTPQLPIGTLAMLRLPMMLVGVAVCVALFVIFDRLERRTELSRAIAIPLLITVAALCYSTLNFHLFYAGFDVFATPVRSLTKIYSYLTEFVWIFVAWTALYYATRNRVLARSPKSRTDGDDGMWIKDGRSNFYLHFTQVQYVEAERDYVRIHTAEDSYLVRTTMIKMEEQLKDAGFVRIHRSVLAPGKSIRRVGRDASGRLIATLASGAVLPVGRAYLPAVKNESCGIG